LLLNYLIPLGKNEYFEFTFTLIRKNLLKTVDINKFVGQRGTSCQKITVAKRCMNRVQLMEKHFG